MAGRLDSRDYTTPLVGRFILRQLDRRAPCGDPHLEADNRAGHLAEQRRVHLGARPWRIGADARFMRRGQSVELCYQFGVLELTHHDLHLYCDIIHRRHLIGRSEESRVGKQSVSTARYWWSTDLSQTNISPYPTKFTNPHT